MRIRTVPHKPVRLGEWIKEKRIERGWSQRDLAQKLGIAQSNVSRWENFTKAISKDTAEQLCEVFDLPMSSADYFVRRPTRKYGPRDQSYKSWETMIAVLKEQSDLLISTANILKNVIHNVEEIRKNEWIKRQIEDGTSTDEEEPEPCQDNN